MTVSKLFTPFTIRSVTFPNRIVLSPMCQYAAVEGEVKDWHLAHHSRFALSGVGGAIVEATGVTKEGRITPGCLGLWHGGQIEGLARITKLYRSHGIPVGIQLAHAGRKASSAAPWDGAGPLSASAPEAAWRTVGPSPIAHTLTWPTPHALSAEEIAEIVESFAAAARRAVEAGFDFVEVHGAHGYLLHSFLSPLANMRNDGYGGTAEKRMRFALEVAAAVRTAIPSTMPLFWRVSAVDHDPQGLGIGDTVQLSAALKQSGIDVIDASSGGINGPIARANIPQHPGHQVPFAAQIRREADIATMAVGLIVDGAQAENVIAHGSADLVALGRELLADPAFAYRAAQALKLPSPEQVLPAQFAFYLTRREQVLSAFKRQ
ncbi:MAG TPA: NADH:flavin oxidoreductase/NADH oxidase [Shinella sp.]|uniref:NADH:flavin oxidoreductase/NADH oxidase n=1 Tax=Shinella sp. TaxID=1870904 RepID=UPI002E0FF5C8|nr:NADH:flavin oxidoreductase/NADH oxidase [Shinella sp.]